MKRFVLAAIIALLAFVCAGCAQGGSNAPSGEPTEGNLSLSANTGSALAFTAVEGATEAAEADITINEGESFVVAGKLSAGEVDITTENADNSFTDTMYEGTGVGQTEIPAGSYHVTVEAKGATGVVYVLSYPGDLDIMNTDNEDLIAQIEGFINGAA